MPRPRCSVFIATSLDGFIARPNGGIDWLAIVERPGEDYGFKSFFDSIDTLVMGRKTYETALSFDTWPYAGKRCVVLTHATPTSRHGEQFYAGDLAALVDRLGAEGSKRVYVDGGAVIAQFLASKLIDDVTVSLIPILLGDGAPLAPKIGADVRLELVEHRAFESGLVQLTYRVAHTT
jgi:dihydrofolate reductase